MCLGSSGNARQREVEAPMECTGLKEHLEGSLPACERMRLESLRFTGDTTVIGAIGFLLCFVSKDSRQLDASMSMKSASPAGQQNHLLPNADEAQCLHCLQPGAFGRFFGQVIR